MSYCQHSWTHRPASPFQDCFTCGAVKLQSPFTTTKWKWAPAIDPDDPGNWPAAPMQVHDYSDGAPPASVATPPTRPTCSKCGRETSAYLDAYYGTDKELAKQCAGCRG